MRFFGECMKMRFILTAVLIGAMALNGLAAANPPETRRIAQTDTIHGFVITDYFRWLETKTDPDVAGWSRSQHQYTLDAIRSTPEIPGLKNEIRAYIDRDIVSSPFFRGEREFFTAKKKGDQQYKLYTRLKGKEILVFDPEKIDTSGKSAMSGMVFTKDGNKAAIGLQKKGNEITDYRIIDTRNGKILGNVLKEVYGFSWTKDEKHAYITIRNQEIIKKQEPLKTYLHTIGEDFGKNVFLGAPADAKNNFNIWDSDEADITFVTEGDFYSGSVKMKPTGSNEDYKLLYDSKKFEASPLAKNGRIYFMTNHEAPNFMIYVADSAKPEFKDWKVFYPEKETVLENYVITSDYVIIQDKKDVISRLSAYDLNGKFVKEIELPETADVGGMSFHKESNSVYIGLNTFTSASKLYKLDGKTLQWQFVYQDKPPIDTKDIESELVFYKSYDGTKIPMFIIHKKGITLDGNNPTILYGYGGFNISVASPGFIGMTAAFINRGGVYALAGLRGGNEYGENWHLNGMLFKKQNTFDDFHAAAEYLIENKYTSAQKLGIKGGSNGGLLVGAAVTQRPDLYKAAICAVPLLDMLRYHRFLIARYWIPEYGDPDKKEDFLNILKYSPYQNIRPGFNYPTILVKAGENDARVDPLHAKKFAAALQNNPGQKNPVYLFVDFESGHGSGQSVDQMVENSELEWRFIMHALGM